MTSYHGRMTQPVLEIVGVRKSYGRTVALGGVSFAVRAGELFGLLGPNGAGKTTLMSILAGLTDASAGEVRLFGKRFTAADRDARRQIGIATQDLALYPELTARENLRFFGKLYGFRDPDLATRVAEMLAAVGLTDRGDHRAGTFSGGMKRRLNLAVALVHRPSLLLLDEPTTGVDPQSRNHIFEQVRAANAAGLTVIYTSHYMEEVQALCPRLAILDNGLLIACDTLSNLLSRQDAVATLTLPAVTDDLPDRLRAIPGVTGVTRDGNTLRVTAADLPPLLPRVVAECRELTALDLAQPGLERVFLSLTGRALRD